MKRGTDLRKVTFGGACSLDGYFARKDNAVDWLMWSDEAGEIMNNYWKNIDAIVMGRRTYEVAQKMSKGKSDPYLGISSYVCSRTLPARKAKDVEIVSDAVAFLRELRKRPGKEICVMGGGNLACSLLEAGVIDEIGFNIHPVLLGEGIPLFHEMKRQVDLELLESRQFKNGCVYVLYRVKKVKAKRRRS